MQGRIGTISHGQLDTIQCPKCGNCGVIKWNFVQTPNGPKKDFVGLAGSFFERMSNKPPYLIEIVCDLCRVEAHKLSLTDQTAAIS